jgi:2-amino-4-hydroxy-6-hydroxymethyldihydropteridine diphosphokinase
MRESALISLGSNATSQAGSPRESLVAALSTLTAAGLPPVAVSRFFRSPAWPTGSGPEFVNACAVVATDLGPEGTLARLHAVEAEFGRVRTVRWGPRTLDLDLLFHGSAVQPDRATWQNWRDLPPDRQQTEAPGALILPHPRIADRGFVLLPLAEIAAGFVHPVTRQTVADMLKVLPPKSLAGMAPL